MSPFDKILLFHANRTSDCKYWMSFCDRKNKKKTSKILFIVEHNCRHLINVSIQISLGCFGSSRPYGVDSIGSDACRKCDSLFSRRTRFFFPTTSRKQTCQTHPFISFQNLGLIFIITIQSQTSITSVSTMTKGESPAFTVTYVSLL